jgi:hypothetical protein
VDAGVAWLGVVFPSCCVLACILIGRHYLVQARAAAKHSREEAETSRLAAQDADARADDAHAIAVHLQRRYGEVVADQLGPADDQGGVRPPDVDDRPTEGMERVMVPEQLPEPELESLPLARTPAQRLRAAGADGGRHRLVPSPGPRAQWQADT